MPMTAHRALTPTGDDRRAQPLPVVIAVAGDRRCGFPVTDVEEVQRVVRATPLPGAPDGVEGVVDRGGEVVAVLDGRRRLGSAHRAVQLSDHLLFLRTRGRLVALRVDAVVGIAAVQPEDLDRGVAAAAGLAQQVGVARLDDGLLVVHDADRFVSGAELSAIAAAVAAVEQRGS